MPRLPGEDFFNGIPSPRSGRPIAREDTSALYEGIGKFGRGLQEAGGAAMSFAEARARRDKEEREEEARIAAAAAATRPPVTAAAAGQQGSATATGGAIPPASQEEGQFRQDTAADEPREEDLKTQLIAVASIEDVEDRRLAFEGLRAAGMDRIAGQPFETDEERDDALLGYAADADRTFGRLLAACGALSPQWTEGEPIPTAERVASQIEPEAIGDEEWIELATMHEAEAGDRPPEDMLALRDDPETAELIVGAHVARNVERLREAGVEVTPGNLLLASTVGAEAAIGILRADDDTPLTELAAPLPEGSPVPPTAGKAIAWATATMAGVPDRGPPILSTLAPNETQKLAQTSQVRAAAARQTLENTAYKKAIQAIAEGSFSAEDIDALVEAKAITRPDRIAGLRAALGDHEAELTLRGEATAHFADDAFVWNEADPQHRAWADGVWHAVPDAAEHFLAPDADEEDRARGEDLALAIVDRIGFVPPAMAASITDALASDDRAEVSAARLFLRRLGEVNPQVAGQVRSTAAVPTPPAPAEPNRNLTAVDLSQAGPTKTIARPHQLAAQKGVAVDVVAPALGLAPGKSAPEMEAVQLATTNRPLQGPDAADAEILAQMWLTPPAAGIPWAQQPRLPRRPLQVEGSFVIRQLVQLGGIEREDAAAFEIALAARDVGAIEEGIDAINDRAAAAASAGETTTSQRLRELGVLLAYYAGLLPDSVYGIGQGMEGNVAFEHIADGTGGDYAPNLDNIGIEGHEYWVVTEICPASMQCTAEEIAHFMAGYSLPTQDLGERVENNRAYPVYDPRPWMLGVHPGDVQVYISPDGLTVVNRALPGHWYEGGQVTRTAVMSADGAWYVITRGFGNNSRGDENNQWQGPQVFKYMDRRMSESIINMNAFREQFLTPRVQ